MVYNARPSRDAFINANKKKGETLMKTALIRILTIATLATSISAFAAADDAKHNDAPAASASSQQQGCAAYTQKEKKQKNAKSQRDDQRTEQEKEFDHVLMGYFG
jgi:flagellar basal body-associated protein FliL